MEFKTARWMTVPRTEGHRWEEDPRYDDSGRAEMSKIGEAGGSASGRPTPGFMCDRGDGVWIPCNPFRDGAKPIWIWWAQ